MPQRRPPPLGELVVTTLRFLSVRRRAGRVRRFFDQLAIFQALQRFVQGAGSESNRTLGALLDRLLDGIPMPRAIRQREHDVEHR